MKDFFLIQQLNTNEEQSKSPLGEGVVYQQYEVEVDGNIEVVNIPLREAENFEVAVNEHDKLLVRKTIKRLLRTFRGIRG